MRLFTEEEGETYSDTCPHCGNEGDGFTETKNLTGQFISVCPNCEEGF